MGPTQLLTHLRNFLTVEADGDLYLTRMADTQMLHGLVEAMTPLQRSWLFSGVVAWWIVDHDGLLHDLAQDADGPRLPPTDGRFQMQEEQIFALLRSTEIAALASQLRNLEASFGLTLSHARQCTFAAEIDREAKLEACDDGERLSLALDRWRAVQSQGVANV